MTEDSNPYGDSNPLDIDRELTLLKRIPKEHYTEYLGKSIAVGKLIDELEEIKKGIPGRELSRY